MHRPEKQFNAPTVPTIGAIEKTPVGFDCEVSFRGNQHVIRAFPKDNRIDLVVVRTSLPGFTINDLDSQIVEKVREKFIETLNATSPHEV